MSAQVPYPDKRVAGYIVAVHGTFTGQPPAGLATYDAIGFFDVLNGQPCKVTVQNQAPLRAAQGCDMIPAKAGDPCDIVMTAGAWFLFALTEQIPVDEAC